MLSLNLSSRILQEARSRGLVAPPSEAVEPVGEGDDMGPHARFWGAHLASLLDEGQLPEEMLNSLAWDAIGGEAGSWLDPFFHGPAPVGDMPGLGDRYRELALLGEGATARVYKALDTLLQRWVAIKILKDPGGPSLTEARAQARVEHPNVCRIYEVGKGFIVLQLVEGPTLAQLAPSLGFEEKLRIVRDVALGVHAAHQKGLIHLDLKLNNVLVQIGEEGSRHPIVSDFGMVRDQAADPSRGCPMGTPPYTSPEQLEGDASRLNRGTDVYALGVMLYVILSGVIPFEIHGFQELLAATAHTPPVPLGRRVPHIPKDLERIVQRCLEKAPAARYATAKDLAEDLERFLRAEPVKAMGERLLYRITKWARRNRKLRWASGIALVLVLGTAGGMAQRNRFLVQQGEWDHRFQKTVEELRAGLDQMYRLPAHDIEGEFRRATRSLDALEWERAKGGRTAEGPGYLALGQARFLLDPKDPGAVLDLQRAWDAGYQVEGVRTWLTLALIRRFQEERRTILAKNEWDEVKRSQLEGCRRHLQDARRLLQGHPSPDQARLSHLLELAEAAAREAPDHDRQIRLARIYRDRFPNDPDGMLEEAEALGDKADELTQKAGPASNGYPLPCAAEVEPLRQEAHKILRYLVQIAPSHPGAYGAMARWYQRQDQCPTEQTPPREVLHAEIRKCLDAGLRVSPHHAQLISLDAQFTSSGELACRLERGLDPAPVEARLRALFRKSLEEPGWASRIAVANALCSYVWLCRVFDRQATLPLHELVHDLLRGPWPAGGIHPLTLGPVIGRLMLETGQDPRPCLTELLNSKPPADEIEALVCVSGYLVLVEYAWLWDLDARTFLAQANARMQAMPPRAQFRDQLGLTIRLWEVRLRPDPAACDRLEQAIAQRERGAIGVWRSQASLDLLEARLTLARCRLKAGQNAGAVLHLVRRALEAPAPLGGMPAVCLDRYRAELCLLEAHYASAPIPVLQEGLAASRRILGALKPGPGEKRCLARPRPAVRYAGAFFLPGQLLKLQGELLLSLAQADARPGARVRWARRAADSFQLALQKNRNLEHHTAPLLAQAKILLLPVGGSRARS